MAPKKNKILRMIISIGLLIFGITFPYIANATQNTAIKKIQKNMLIDAGSTGNGFISDICPGVTLDTNKTQFIATETSLIIMYGGYFDSYYDNFYYEVYLWDLTTINQEDISGNNSQKLSTLNTDHSGNKTVTILSLTSTSSIKESKSKITQITNLVVGHEYFLALIKIGNLRFENCVFQYVENYEDIVYSRENFNSYDQMVGIGQGIIFIAVCWLIFELVGLLVEKSNQTSTSKPTTNASTSTKPTSNLNNTYIPDSSENTYSRGSKPN